MLREWVPVTDGAGKLPPAGVYVLVTTIGFIGLHVEIAFRSVSGEWMTQDYEWLVVIAWQPLPEPYQLVQVAG